MAHYYMMNKPTGCITACRDEHHKTVMEYLPLELQQILKPVGRLDKDTEGLLLFTDDGKWNQKLMSPKHHVPKTYFFWALGEWDEKKKEQLEHGVLLRGSQIPTAPAYISVESVGELSQILPLVSPDLRKGVMKNPANHKVFSGFLTITEGKKHQVKRMLKAMGCYVVYLKRVSIGDLQLDKSLSPGEIRPLTNDELALF